MRARLLKSIRSCVIRCGSSPAVHECFSPNFRTMKATARGMKGRCVESGLAVREDAIGNYIAWVGLCAGAPAVGTGSHIDAIPMPENTTAWSVYAVALSDSRLAATADFGPRHLWNLSVYSGRANPLRNRCRGSRIVSGTLPPDPRENSETMKARPRRGSPRKQESAESWKPFRFLATTTKAFVECTLSKTSLETPVVFILHCLQYCRTGQSSEWRCSVKEVTQGCANVRAADALCDAARTRAGQWKTSTRGRKPPTRWQPSEFVTFFRGL